MSNLSDANSNSAKAKKYEIEKLFSKASAYYKIAGNIFRELEDQNDPDEVKIKFQAFNCEAKSIECLLKDKDIDFLTIKKKSDLNNELSYVITDFNLQSEKELVKEFIDEVKVIKKNYIYPSIKESENKYTIKYDCTNYLINIFKQFENFLYNKGYTDEAIEIFYEKNCEQTKRVCYDLILLFKTPWGLRSKHFLHSLWILFKNITLGLYYPI
ncbi:MAG: hypothetical protein GF353_29360, partial [Candidatus Lokiarchaeota archaeon]|nr:hypothetical protein [Candidatus Lokiarchaeota archaeon]